MLVIQVFFGSVVSEVCMFVKALNNVISLVRVIDTIVSLMYMMYFSMMTETIKLNNENSA